LDHLVRAQQKGLREGDPKRFGGPEIYRELEYGCLLEGGLVLSIFLTFERRLRANPLIQGEGMTIAYLCGR
jgi:hypothetical protein